MDNDSGWAAKEIELICREEDGHSHKITLTCRWVELVQAWNGIEDAYFLISGLATSEIPHHPWVFVTFTDARGKTHHYPIQGATPEGPQALRLPRQPHHPG